MNETVKQLTLFGISCETLASHHGAHSVFYASVLIVDGELAGAQV